MSAGDESLFPFIARITPPTGRQWSPPPWESGVLEVPVDRLIAPGVAGCRWMAVRGHVGPQLVPTLTVDDRFLWGPPAVVVGQIARQGRGGRWAL